MTIQKKKIIQDKEGFFKKQWNYYFVQPWNELTDKSNSFYDKLLKLFDQGNSSLYRMLFAFLVIFLFFFMPVISFDFGRNSDETVSNNYGKDILNYYGTGGHDRSVLNEDKQGYSHMIYYGLSFDFLCALINKYISPFGEFETRHLLNALFGFLAMLFAALIALKLANWRAACITMLFIFLTPTFFGHSMNNAKDIPFAAGYIMSIYFLIRMLDRFPEVKFKDILWLAMAIGFTGSNKINGWLILTSYLIFFAFLLWVFQLYKSRNQLIAVVALKKMFFPIVLVIIISYIISIAFWPYAYSNIFTRPLESLKTFENVGKLMIHYELFDGRLINMENVPWYYTFKLMLITLPLFVLAGFFIAIISIKWMAKRFNISIFGLLIFITFIPIIYAIYKHSKLYNGWRHFLFIYPSFAVVAGMGWEFIFQIMKKKYLKYAVVLVFLALMIKTTVWSLKNHPNEIVYFNELTGGVKGAFGYYELDPLATSGRQAVEWLIDHQIKSDEKVVVLSNIEGESLEYYAKKHKKNIKFFWTKGYNTSQVHWDYLILNNSFMSHKQLASGLFPPKATIHTIDAGGTPLIAIIKRVNDYKFIGFKFFQQNQFDSSLYYYQQAYDYDNKDFEAIDMFAASHINLGHYNDGLFYLNKSLNLFPEDYFAWENVGTIYMLKDNFEKAIIYFKKALSYRINAKDALMNLGKSYYNLGDYDSSLYYCTLYDRYYPRDVELFILIAEIFKAKNDLPQALQVLNKALQIRPGDPDIMAMVDELKSGQSAGAYTKEFNLAIKYAQMGRLDSMINILGRIIQADPKNYMAWLNRGVAWYQMGDPKKAIADIDKAIEINPKNADGYFKKAQIFFALRDNKNGFEYIHQALKLAPNNWEMLIERGNAYYTSNNFSAALNDYTLSITQKPDYFKTYYARGLCYFTVGNLSAALNDLNQAIVLNPEYYETYNTRVIVLTKLKRYKEAYNDLNFLKNKGLPFDKNLEKEIMGKL